jgi:hypothetical protein
LCCGRAEPPDNAVRRLQRRSQLQAQAPPPAQQQQQQQQHMSQLAAASNRAAAQQHAGQRQLGRQQARCRVRAHAHANKDGVARRVVVTGLGLVSPLGHEVSASRAADGNAHHTAQASQQQRASSS